MIRRIAILMLLASVTGAPAATASELPAMGEPVDQVLSPRQEAEIGRELMAQARRTLDLNHDPEIAAYLDAVGRRLAAHSDSTPVNGYTFFVVRNPSINAFAGPGGYIGVHSGLILAADTEAQMAGVIAHEIAHVSQRHIARSFARSQRDSYATLAAILAGIVIGSQNPQAGQAAITGGIAAEQQRRINYTRSNEYEADRIGIALLARAGYSPLGMTEFFETLMKSSGAGGGQVPEFLRTHPLSQNRIAEAAARAESLERPDQRRDTLSFQLMKARIEAEYSDQPGRLHDRWRQREPSDDENLAAAREYGLAVLELRLDQPETARKRLDELHAGAPDNLHYGLGLARALQATGDGEAALATWRDTRALHPDSYPVTATGNKLLLGNDQADRAVQLVTDYLRGDGPIEPEAWRLLAEAADAAGRPGRSHEALGEYYVRIDRLEQALTQLELALRRAQSGSTEHTRLSTRVEQVRELRRERLASNPLGG
ncbi:MAG: M48 family metalloprotease [Halofilum sp. (in: g-proteobacteria)]|nr:M48 family metalloprotease [Halofilum sp. (in: g-proteobacteria)]